MSIACRTLGALALLFALGARAEPPSAPGTLRGKVTAQGPAANPIVVYLEHVAATDPAPARRRTLAQKNQDFEPRALVVQKGQVVDFPNYDKVYHNVFSVSPGNEFDAGLYRAGAGKSVEMKALGEVDVYCNIHPDMVAKILVLENHFHAEAAQDGSWSIEGVPPGEYTLVAWSATLESQKMKVEVKSSVETRADFVLWRRGDRSHLNKNGEQYGRYR